MSYCTPTEVLARMGRGEATTAVANQNVQDAIDAATQAIDEDTHRVFHAPLDETKQLPVLNCESRRLYVPDLISVTSIKVDDDSDGVFETTLTSADYELDSWHARNYLDENGDRAVWPFEFVTILGRAWPRTDRRRVVEIEGTWGWPTIPSAVNQACSILATRLMQRMSAAPFGVQSFGELGASGIRSTDPDYQHLIAPFKVTSIA